MITDPSKVRDLTASRLTRRSIRADIASDYRDARDAYLSTMETVAIGYAPEERDYRATVPAPTWRAFLEGHSR